MHAKRLFALNAVLLPLMVAAQLLPAPRLAGPKPKLTPAVEQIRRERTRFRVEAGEVQLPPSVDNSRERFFPPLINQTGGSCAQAAGIGYMFTYEMNRLRGTDASEAANRMSYLFVWNLINEGEDQGSFVEQGLQVAKSFGVMTEEDYGTPGLTVYKWATGYERYLRAMHFRAAEILTFDDSIPVLKRYLYDAGRGEHPGGLLTFSIESTGWEFDTHYEGPSETGYHALMTSLGDDGSHALTIVGYDDLVEFTDAKGSRHTGAFIVCNSWGDYFYHDRGRFYLPYDFFRDETVSNITLSNSLNAVRVKTYDPQLIFRVALDYTSRDDLRFGMSHSTDRMAQQPRVAYHNAPIMNHQGGDFNMQGQFRPADIEVALDYTPYARPLDDEELQLYFLGVTTTARGQNKGQGEVRAVEVIDLRPADGPRHYTCHMPLPATIGPGTNSFTIPLRPLYRLPASGTPWNAGLLHLRTANSRFAKLEVADSGDGRKVHLRYTIRQ